MYVQLLFVQAMCATWFIGLLSLEIRPENLYTERRWRGYGQVLDKYGQMLKKI